MQRWQHRHVEFAQSQTEETSALWCDVLCRFCEDYHRSTVECLTGRNQSGWMRPQEPTLLKM